MRLLLPVVIRLHLWRTSSWEPLISDARYCVFSSPFCSFHTGRSNIVSSQKVTYRVIDGSAGFQILIPDFDMQVTEHTKTANVPVELTVWECMLKCLGGIRVGDVRRLSYPSILHLSFFLIPSSVMSSLRTENGID
jgi:hypothetical protein